MKNILFLLILLSFKTFAFTLNSQNNSQFKGWANPEVKFLINTANCPASVDVTSIVSDALAVWNNVSSSHVKLSLEGTTTSVTYANPVTIMCDTNYGNGDQAIADGSPGAAVVQPSSGDTITSGIMYLNASSGRANIKNLSRTLVAVVLAHEFGHLLGLGHSQDVNALMYYNASLKSNLALAQDDIDAITYLYPRDELSGDKALGCALVKNMDHLKPPPTLNKMIIILFLLMPLFLLFIYREKRNRHNKRYMQ